MKKLEKIELGSIVKIIGKPHNSKKSNALDLTRDELYNQNGIVTRQGTSGCGGWYEIRLFNKNFSNKEFVYYRRGSLKEISSKKHDSEVNLKNMRPDGRKRKFKPTRSVQFNSDSNYTNSLKISYNDIVSDKDDYWKHEDNSSSSNNDDISMDIEDDDDMDDEIEEGEIVTN